MQNNEIQYEYYDDVKFEYHIKFSRSGSRQKLEEELNELGNEGWELISVVYSPDLSWSQYVFKRKIFKYDYNTEN